MTLAILGLVIAITGLSIGLWCSRIDRRIREIQDLLVEIRDDLCN